MENQIHKLIILVEDSPEDYAATLRAFKKVGMKNEVIRFETGDECLDYLFGKGDYEGKQIVIPGLMMLDLNLPGTDGREVLRIIKSSPKLNKIPIVVLTTSSDEKDIESCYESGANSYIQKPVNFEGFINAITKLKEYWFEISILPK